MSQGLATGWVATPFRSAARVTISLLCVVVMTSTMSACGFKPRGSVTLPEGVQVVRVEGPVNYVDELDTLLRGEGVTVIESGDHVTFVGPAAAIKDARDLFREKA